MLLLALSVWFTLVRADFNILPVGVGGGVYVDSLSAYALSSTNDKCSFILFDAGTVLTGLRTTNQLGFLEDLACEKSQDVESQPIDFLQKRIQAYLISHAHLDHVGGLILNSVEDNNGKVIVGLNQTIESIQRNLFNDKTWINFGPTGLKKYRYLVAEEKEQWTPLPNTKLQFKAFPVYHAWPTLSTAFLVTDGDNYILYFGDVGPDSVENERIPFETPGRRNATHYVWKQIAPLVVEKKLLGVFLECSYPDGRPPELLFGHLTPKWITEALSNLNEQVQSVNSSSSVRGLNVVITHIKPVPGQDVASQIQKELAAQNTLHVNYVLAVQGKPFTLSSSGVVFYSLAFSSWIRQNISLVASVSSILVAILVVVVTYYIYSSRKANQHDYEEIETENDALDLIRD
jgi:3',5'-cyclic-nucleotide phosphodiesterase